VKAIIKGTGTEVNLTQRDFVASGGQAAIYTRNGIAFKIYHNPADALPSGKIAELQAITDPRVIKPENILVDSKGSPLGYTTKFVKDSYVLCQLFPKAFRDREHLDHDKVRGLVRQLQEMLENIHKASILAVDYNELNFLVSKGFDKVFAIDVDSYQTAHYPAPALMESVRDWTVKNNAWTQLSDWYSFAVVSFSMFTGIHPFKGQYQGPKAEFKGRLPSDPDDDPFIVTRRRMMNNVSIFDPSVKTPACIYPVTVIPPAYRAWYEAVFAQGKRCLPPSEFGAAVVIVPKVQTVLGAAHLDITEIDSYEGQITGVWSDGSHLVVLTDKGVWLGKGRTNVGAPKSAACGFSPLAGRSVLLNGDSGIPTLINLTDRVGVAFGLNVEEVSSYDGRLYARTTDHVHEVVLTDIGSQVIATTKPVVNVLPHATKLHSGVVVQNMLGSVFVSLLSAPGVARQVRIKELDSYKILDARFDSGVLMVVGAKKGKYDRLVFRFDLDNSYDVRVVSDITPSGLNFVTLDSGVCVCMTEEEKLEVFKTSKGHQAMKVIEDKVLGSDMHLAKQGGTVLFSRGNKLYQMKMK